ncbi:MAG: molybdopterin-dependent oxidoreductase [Candidatus Sigynarchaeota archaeon]
MPIETKNRVTCTGCALLCDDIAVDVQFGTIQAVHNACLRGSKKFLQGKNEQLLKTPFVGGKATSYDDALAEAARIFKGAKNIVIAGGTHGTIDAVRALVKLGIKHGAKFAIPHFSIFTQLKRAIRKNGMDFFSIGESVNNADLIVFWGANPVDLAPKLLVRAAFSRGRYRQSGKEVKKLAVIDDYPTPTMERADIKILVDDQNHSGMLHSLSSALIDQNASDPSLSDLVDAIKNCEYCTLFVGEGILNKHFLDAHPAFINDLLCFIRALNAKRRVAMLPIFYPWNAAGLMQELACTSERIDCFDIDDLPSHANNIDVILAFGLDLVSRFTRNAAIMASGVQVIAIDFKRTPTTDLAHVVIPPSISGIESGGTAMRLDGIILVLNPPRQQSERKKTDEDILNDLYEKT